MCPQTQGFDRLEKPICIAAARRRRPDRDRSRAAGVALRTDPAKARGQRVRAAGRHFLLMAEEAATAAPRRRQVRSFVRRPGRLTPAQARALDELLPHYGLDPAVRDLRQAFERPAPLIVEIGCGNGAALIEMAGAAPNCNFIGIEVHEPGVGRLLRGLEQHRLNNARVAMRDAVEVLHEQTAVESIDGLRIYFPDPWPKKRHHKRRLIQPGFVILAATRLASGGLLHLATDWAPYAEWMVEVLAGEPTLQGLGNPYVETPAWRPQTHFERRGERRGHAIFDLLYRKQPV